MKRKIRSLHLIPIIPTLGVIYSECRKIAVGFRPTWTKMWAPGQPGLPREAVSDICNQNEWLWSSFFSRLNLTKCYVSLRNCMDRTWSSQAKYTDLHFLGVSWSIHPEERDFHLNLLTECPCEQVWWNAKAFPITSMLLIISQWFLTWPLGHKSCHSNLFCQWLQRFTGHTSLS